MDPYYGNMEDEELLTLARESGVLSSGEPAAPQTMIPGGETHDPNALYLDEAPVEETRQDFREWAPRQLGFEQSNYSQPVPGTTTKAGVRTSDSGFSPGKYAQVEQTKPGLNADLQAADNRANAGALDMSRALGSSHESGVLAARVKADAEVNKISEEGRQALVVQRMQDEFAAEESKMNAMAQGQSNQAKADYMAALADFRASRVDPSQLWSNMTGGERFGTLATAFVHDFLGAKGINTSAMATFNKAIDRNIDSQLQAIKTKGEVAEGFKSLWYMQRNQSASDAEARTRVRGFLLEGAKQAVIANMAPYEAALASAQGKAAIAELDKELSKNLIEVYKHADTNAIALRNQAIEKWRVGVQAAMHSQSLAVEREKIDAAKKQKEGGMKLIHDPDTGEAVGFFQPGISPALEDKAREKFIETYDTSAQIKTMREIMRRSPKAFDLTAPTRLSDTDQQMYDSASVRLAHNMVKALGERATDKDVDQMIKGLRAKTMFNMADAERVLAFTEEEILKPAQRMYSGVAYDLPEDSELRQIRSGRGKSILEGSRSEAGNTANPPPKTSDEILREGAHELIGGPQSREPLPAGEQSSEVINAHNLAKQKYPHLFMGEGKGLDNVGYNAVNRAVSAEAPTYSMKGLTDLRRLARKGDKNAKAQLETLAKPFLAGVSDDREAAGAALMLETMGDDPEPTADSAKKK